MQLEYSYGFIDEEEVLERKGFIGKLYIYIKIEESRERGNIGKEVNNSSNINNVSNVSKTPSYSTYTQIVNTSEDIANTTYKDGGSSLGNSIPSQVQQTRFIELKNKKNKEEAARQIIQHDSMLWNQDSFQKEEELKVPEYPMGALVQRDVDRAYIHQEIYEMYTHRGYIGHAEIENMKDEFVHKFANLGRIHINNLISNIIFTYSSQHSGFICQIMIANRLYHDNIMLKVSNIANRRAPTLPVYINIYIYIYIDDEYSRRSTGRSVSPNI